MTAKPETRLHGIAALKAVVALACAMLVVTGMLHDTQHAESDSIESCAVCPQLGHAVPTNLVGLEHRVDFDEIRVAVLPASDAPTPRPSGPRLTRAPPLS